MHCPIIFITCLAAAGADVPRSHSHLQLPLVPVEQFLSEFPDHANDDENALMTARIAHERAQRETLEQQRLELAKRKQKLISENKKRKDDLANLDKNLELFIDVGLPSQYTCTSPEKKYSLLT